jgi:4,5-DOPA dioxygenase extradiol
MSVPAAFISHGSPMQAVEQDEFNADLRAWADGIPRPRAIVVVSAHWEARGRVRVTGAERPSLIYDFSGFPPELYDLRYPAPGDPALAAEIARMLDGDVDGSRGWDHGAWMPLLHAFPKADVPVLEVSLPLPRTPDQILRVGRTLAPLRDRGVLLIGSGGLVHNLSRVRFDDKRAPVEGWAEEFDRWVGERIQALDVDALQDYRSRGPNAALAVPTTEHYDPVLFTLGAAGPEDRVRPIHTGMQYGTLSMRSFAISS